MITLNSIFHIIFRLFDPLDLASHPIFIHIFWFCIIYYALLWSDCSSSFHDQNYMKILQNLFQTVTRVGMTAVKDSMFFFYPFPKTVHKWILSGFWYTVGWSCCSQSFSNPGLFLSQKKLELKLGFIGVGRFSFDNTLKSLPHVLGSACAPAPPPVCTKVLSRCRTAGLRGPQWLSGGRLVETCWWLTPL